MIRIEIIDPHLMQQSEIVKTANYLMSLVGMSLAPAPKPHPLTDLPQGSPGQSTQNWDDEKEPIVNACPIVNPILPPVPEKEIFNPFAARDEKFASVVDSQGLPWDNRIHSRTRSKTSDGKWRYQRGVHDVIVTTVEAELRIAAQIPVTAEPTPIIPVPPPAPVPYVQPAPVKPLIDLMPVNDFPALMNKITAAVNAQKITSQTVIDIVRECGLPSLPVVATRPDLIPSIMARIDAVLNG